ncbi:DUF2892 domain-containing protein [Rhodoplanes sp. TEM]|uniref:DUF2892 domain-containing protein n=1 Tax=Rhodoplanes tepidamans TaxID=200616 RepID=A0ABT5JA53_RHOTP|nr:MULTISPECIES: DUF2892 domain-containing protein [Rhodoplanes]MDC7786352.1 DUF2892 domain-containing protein [Rhodoplanes tepidamans]MDC7984689.1 DUF2892 domain-containing protein [Rhodoplanes sp. TEM]MDQ0354096.1 hypothetical protein [Rhodoplanes tepidamans]
MTIRHTTTLPGTPQRVRRMTDAEVNAAIDRQIERNVLFYAEHPDEIPIRLRALDAEWDVERALQANAAAIGLAGSLLALTRGGGWFALPAVVGGFLLQHATQGWCPPLPVMRRMGFRTAREIDVERNALKALRGDYADLPKAGDSGARARAALQAARSGPFASASAPASGGMGAGPGAAAGTRSTASPPTVPKPA